MVSATGGVGGSQNGLIGGSGVLGGDEGGVGGRGPKGV